MLSPATLLAQLITLAHSGNAAAADFCRKHVVKPQSISSILNGNGNTGLSFKQLEKWANKEGYTIGTLLHPYTGDMVADAMAHAKAAAIEARHVLEYQDELTEEQREQIALLDKIIDSILVS